MKKVGDHMRVKGFLIDIDGVLTLGGRPIEGAVPLIAELRAHGIPFRCISNTTRRSRKMIADELGEQGFSIPASALFTPPAAAIAYMRESGKNRGFLISTGNIDPEFEEAGIMLLDAGVDFVLIGDAGSRFSYELLNHAFRLVLDGAEILALERDRYWMGADGLMLSAGPFVAALEYATGKTARVMGKPSPSFFSMALHDMGMPAGDVAMIGDDITTDIGGAKRCGMQGILVRTGKFRQETLDSAEMQPDEVIDSIAGLRRLL
jgi:HAD superfamily hydrolase (TIGR01458 family)